MDTLLKVEALKKSYTAPVLVDFDFELKAGEVHALVGSNGAGKSTLAKILAGLTDFTSGLLTFNDRPHRPRSKQEAARAGIVMVMQELNLIPTLSVAENLFFHDLPNRFGVVSKRTLRTNALEALVRVNLNQINPDTPAGKLGVGQQQLIEIAAALTQECRLLVLDEPTAALTDPEIETLFGQIRTLAEQGVTVLYISHRMEEIRAICDRVTIMRDGKRINTYVTKDVNNGAIVRDMAGRDVWSRPSESRDVSIAPVVLQADRLSRLPAVRDLSLSLHRGEILGLAGLVGSGRTESLRLLFGADCRDSGRLIVNGQHVTFSCPADAVAAGLGMIPEDRKTEGLLMSQSIRSNACLSAQDLYSRFGCVSQEKETRAATDGCNSLDVKRDDVEQAVERLSGGNQQKVILLRWLLRNSSILLLDEPTRGIDVVAKAGIYTLLRELSASGKSLIIVSSELLELMALCDRIAVISAGAVCEEFMPDNWSQEAITQAAFSAYLTAS